MEKQRIMYFDIAKGIAIICVIIGHMGIDSVNRVVFSFHMPLFFLISGYFLSFKDEPIEFVKKKINQLLPPYLLTGCLIVIGAVVVQWWMSGSTAGLLDLMWYWIKAMLYGSGSQGNLLPEGIGSIGAIWYLLALLFALIEIRIVYEKKYALWIVIMLAYAAIVTGRYFWFPFSIQAGALCAIFVYLGKKIKDGKYLERKKPVAVEIVAFVIWGVSISYCNIFAAVLGRFSNGLLDVGVAVIGTYFVIRVSQFIENHVGKLASILVFYGRNTMVIMCAHLFELNVVPWDRVWSFLGKVGITGFFTQLWVVIGMKILWATLAVYVVKRIKFMNNIFSGKVNICPRIIEGGARENQREKWYYNVMAVGVLIVIYTNEVLNTTDINILNTVAYTLIFVIAGIYLGSARRNIIVILKSVILNYALVTIVSVLCAMIIGGKKDAVSEAISLIGAMSATSRHFNSVGTVNVVWIYVCLGIATTLFSVIWRMLKNKCNEAKGACLIGVGVLGAVIARYYGFFLWSLDVAIVMIVFVAAGYIFITEYEQMKQEQKVITMVVSGTVWYTMYHLGARLDVISREYSCIPIGWLCSIAGCIFIVCVMEYFSMTEGLSKVMTIIGKFSWVIIIIYYLDTRWVNTLELLSNVAPFEITKNRGMIFICFVIFGCSYIFSKIEEWLEIRERRDTV